MIKNKTVTFVFQHIFQAPFVLISYYAILLFFTYVYLIYYVKLFEKVRNKQKYVTIIFPNICLTFMALTACALLVNLSILPFGGLYVYTLISFRTIHIQTLERLNAEGAL